MGNCANCVPDGSGKFLPPDVRNTLLKDFLAKSSAIETAHFTASKVGPTTMARHTGDFKRHYEACATLGNSELRFMVQLPSGVERNAWIAFKTVATFEEVVAAVTAAGDICNPSACPKMSCGKQIHYEWFDETMQHSEPLPAIDYMRRFVEWAHVMLKNESVLPRDDKEWQPHFLDCMKTLHKRLFRVYAHLYIHHFGDVQKFDCEEILNYQFKHWLFFVRAFDLVTNEQLQPLRHLVDLFETKQGLVEGKMEKEVFVSI